MGRLLGTGALLSGLLIGSPAAAEGLAFRTLDECRASQALTKAASDAAELELKLVAQPLSRDFDEALEKRNKLLRRLSEITSACSKLTIAAKAASGKLGQESAASQVSQMNELHELLSDNVLKAVPNGAVREIIKTGQSTYRSQLAGLAAVLDPALGSLAAREAPATQAPGARWNFATRPDPAVGGSVLGADAAASLDRDVQQWKLAEAVRLERVRREEEARRVEEMRQSAERARLAQIQYAQAQARVEAERQERKSAFGSFLNGVLSGVAVGLAAKNGSSFGGMGTYGGSGNSERCQQTLAQIESTGRSIQSMQQAQQGGVDVQAIQQTIAEGQSVIQANQNWYNQNC